MINVCEQLDHLRSAMFDSLTIERQFARVAKGVDLRSTAGNCAWVRTPQLTFDLFGSSFNIYEFHPPRLAIMGHMV